MYDIVHISYFEKFADQSWQDLKDRFPFARRIQGIKGIHQAHIAAAKQSYTKMLWIVDADAKIVEDFNFDYIVPEHQMDHVHVWNSINPINKLVYGYGGVKLFPTKLTINMDTSKSDVTTSISNNFKVINEISNITAFNTDPFNTWKSAFRECAKLASKTIDRQNENETNERLKVWTTHATGDYSEDALRGANAGMQFGLSSSSDINLINNFEWLEKRFKEY
jgi:hypothetical protein